MRMSNKGSAGWQHGRVGRAVTENGETVCSVPPSCVFIGCCGAMDMLDTQPCTVW